MHEFVMRTASSGIPDYTVGRSLILDALTIQKNEQDRIKNTLAVDQLSVLCKKLKSKVHVRSPLDHRNNSMVLDKTKIT